MLYINHFVQWKNREIFVDGRLQHNIKEDLLENVPASLYRLLGLNYVKFFKMDLLSKVGFLASEILMTATQFSGDHDKVATVFCTASGCVDVDEKFEESRADIASPALFVYTLPNIMLGEICIRNKFKGEQLCTISEKPNAAFLQFYVNDLFEKRGMQACLCGFAEATKHQLHATLLWISKAENGSPFITDELQKIFEN